MKSNRILSRTLLVGCCALALQGLAKPQEISNTSKGAYGYTSISYDSSSNTVIGYSETDLDASLVGDYSPIVVGNMYQNGALLLTQLVKGTDVDDSISVTISVAGSPGATFMMKGTHSEDDSYSDYNQNGQLVYLDPGDLSYWLSQQVDELWSFPFLGDGTQVSTRSGHVSLGSTYDQANLTTPAACGDQRDTIISEYHTAPYTTTLDPRCADFTQFASTTHYNWSNFNTGDYSWAIVRTTLTTGVENVVSHYGSAPGWNSGYRNPAKEYRIDQGLGAHYTRGSRHMAGDAADFNSSASTWQPIHDAGKSAGGCVEPQAYQGGSAAHVHVDWRGQCPAKW